jgi:GNAT superfamily N-acetyltransferase
MQILTLDPNLIPAAAELFVKNFNRQRAAIPILPDTLADPANTAKRISDLAGTCPVFAAMEGDRLLGYLGAWVIDNFRDTPRRAAYASEWAHGVLSDLDPDRQTSVYRALYRTASVAWFEAGCSAHAITILVGDVAARETWFWNGFGMLIVDAVRSLEAFDAPVPEGYIIRKANLTETEDLADIETEHWNHYFRPPVLMTPSQADDSAAFARFLREPGNSVWTAWKGKDLATYIRFEGSSFGSADIVNGAGTIAITGAYTRKAHRGLGLAPAMISAAIGDYHAQGYARCAVDFESVNPEAASFWPKYFTPVCYSLMRVPEREPNSSRENRRGGE